MREKFGAVLDAFEYGAPPHGGIALGIDRWAALLARQTNIREVMAFPKTQSGSDPMLEAPSAPEPEQYEELGLRFVGLPPKPTLTADAADLRRRSTADRGRRGRPGIPALDAIARRPRLAALIGAMCISFSGIFYLYADVSPSTGTVLPGALRSAAAPRWSRSAERRRYGPLPGRARRFAIIAGIFFAGDLMFWHHAIEYVGAGLATVLGNLQVLIVGVVAWLVFGERPSRATLLAVPVVLVGVVLISGVVGAGAYGANPALGRRARARDRVVLLRLPAADPRSAGATRAGRPGRSRSPRSAPPSWRGTARAGHRGSRPDAGPGQPRLAGPARGDVAVDRLPVHLARPAAAAGRRHVDHPARPAGRSPCG